MYAIRSYYETAEGRARIVEGTGNSQLKVKFAPAWVPFAEGVV